MLIWQLSVLAQVCLKSSQLYHNNNNTDHAGSRLEREGDDRSDIDLPGNQLHLLQDASESSSSKYRYYNVIDITINNYVLCNNNIMYRYSPHIVQCWSS